MRMKIYFRYNHYMKILIIEDDKHILSLLYREFEEADCIVDSAMDGLDGEYLAEINSYDIIILDWMLPSKSGIEILQSLRSKRVSTPIIMLSAKGEIEDKVSGLNIGADDYLSKPFSFDELLARVNSLHRRNLSKGINTITINKLTINLEDKSVKKENTNIPLSAKEYELLMFLIKHKNTIVSIPTIQEQLWDQDTHINSNVIQVTIYNLRKKLGKEIIQSYRNLGYKIEDR